MKQAQSIIPAGSEGLDAEDLVKTISQDEFAAFISVPYAVIQVGRGTTPASFPYAITLGLGLFHFPIVRLGVVNLSDVNWTPAVRLYTLLNLERLGFKPDIQGEPPPGYYLFASGLPIAFNEGKASSSKNEELQGAALLLGLVGLFTQSKEFAQLGKQLGNWPAGERVNKAFTRAIQKHMKSPADSPGVPRLPLDSSEKQVLRRAYATLGLSPSTSPEEVTTAYERLQRELSRNQPPQEESVRRAAELKAARDFIVNRHSEDDDQP